MRMVLLSVVAMTAGVWWELGGRGAAQGLGPPAQWFGCGSALCSANPTAIAPTYIVGTCSPGTSNAQYGGSAQVATGNRVGNCVNVTSLSQKAELHQASNGQLWGIQSAPVTPTCGTPCSPPGPVNLGLTPMSGGCKCLRGQQYYSYYEVDGYTSCNPNNCTLFGEWGPLSKQSTTTTAP